MVFKHEQLIPPTMEFNESIADTIAKEQRRALVAQVLDTIKLDTDYKIRIPSSTVRFDFDAKSSRCISRLYLDPMPDPDLVNINKKKEAYEEVLIDLMKNNLFRGHYDKENGTSSYMYGILAVMEVIASRIDEPTHNAFLNLFFKNMEDSGKGKKTPEYTTNSMTTTR